MSFTDVTEEAGKGDPAKKELKCVRTIGVREGCVMTLNMTCFCKYVIRQNTKYPTCICDVIAYPDFTRTVTQTLSLGGIDLSVETN